METATTTVAGVSLTTPLWLQTMNPYVQFGVAVLGGIWIAVQIFYKIKNERKRSK